MSDVWCCPGQSWSQGGPGEARSGAAQRRPKSRCRGTGHGTTAPHGASRLVSTKRQELQSIRLQAKAPYGQLCEICSAWFLSLKLYQGSTKLCKNLQWRDVCLRSRVISRSFHVFVCLQTGFRWNWVESHDFDDFIWHQLVEVQQLAQLRRRLQDASKKLG